MSENRQPIVVPFDDINVALAVVKAYQKLFPADDYVPEVEKDTSCSGATVVIKVPQEKYSCLDWAVEEVIGA